MDSKNLFNNIPENTKTALIIGKNNFAIITTLKIKKINVKEYKINNTNQIVSFLKEQDDKKFNLIILNYDLFKCNKFNLIINLLVDKGDYSIITFANNLKQKKLNNTIEKNKINVFKKFYVRNNFISKHIIFKPFSYYSIFFINKNKIILNYELIFIDKIKRFLFSKKEPIKLLINKK